jgi:photosystem II stability/assembly factor-like uncharacterized protein
MNINQPNTATNGVYSGSLYAFGASGGLFVTQGFKPPITFRTPDILNQYDVTDAIQLTFSARTINSKIGIIKDASNFNTVQAWYDPVSDNLHYDSVNICSCDFVNNININSILSIGKLSNLYFDFKTCVATYFGDPGGFASLFDYDQEFQINDGVFDSKAFFQIINKANFDISGSFVSDLSGTITVSDINNLLKFVVDSNIFNNRNPAVKNYGMADGFVAGDLIFIPEGFSITLSLDIQSETYLPVNNVGPSYLNAIRNKLNWKRGYVKRTTTATTTNISQTTTLPVLLILTDDMLQNFSNYGTVWNQSNMFSGVLDDFGNQIDDSGSNILAISLSTDGQYQSAITNTGNIYVSSDYGATWHIPNNIGYSDTNDVAISFTGIHQTASNGHQIYVSNDYGKTWSSTFNAGTSNIFISISLNGMYQTVVSSGDNVYFSSDYGKTWRPLDTSTDLYQSIEIFPTGGVALSYNGQYQTIVSENIYISSDFGRTWTNVSDDNGFEDRNWSGVAMSSDGKYQTAIESGGEVHISSDYGNNWIFIDNQIMYDKIWQYVSVSATGQYQTVVEQQGNVYTSIDYGNTWNIVNDPTVQNKTWQAIAVSLDGTFQTAIETNGGTIHSSTVYNTTNPKPNCSC